MVFQCVFSSISPKLAFELSIAKNKNRHSVGLDKGGHQRQPSILMTARKLKQISTLFPLFQHLPKPIVQKAIELYQQGKIGKLLKLLITVDKLAKLYQLQKCKAIFSFHLCSNSSAQPFFLWAKISANKIIKERRFIP